MVEIIPALIAESRDELSRKLDAVRGAASWVQVDITDGIFAPRKTWNYLAGAPRDIGELKGELKIELHLMVSRPENVLNEWIASGADRILVHAESTTEIGLIIDTLRESRVASGIVLNLETPIEVIEPWASDVSVVQLMAIAELGSHGMPFQESVIPKLQALRLKYPDLTIQVDGGLDSLRLRTLIDMGANGLVVGGAIFNAPKPLDALRELQKSASE